MDIDWREYEAAKKLLPDNLKPKEYEAALQIIVKHLETEVKKNVKTERYN